MYSVDVDNHKSNRNPIHNEPNNFYEELAELFAVVQEELESYSKQYIEVVKHFVKGKLNSQQLRKYAQRLLPSDLIYIHDQFIHVLCEGCQLTIASKHASGTFRDPAADAKEKCVPHVSIINALLVLRSLENGWAIPDLKASNLLGDAIKTILADRVDAAAHVASSYSSNFDIDTKQDMFKKNCTRSIESLHCITPTDLYESFSNRQHFLGDETERLLLLKCHATFYERLKTSLSQHAIASAPVTSIDECFTCIRAKGHIAVSLPAVVRDAAKLSVTVPTPPKHKSLLEKTGLWTRPSRAHVNASSAISNVEEINLSRTVESEISSAKIGLPLLIPDSKAEIHESRIVETAATSRSRTKASKRKLSDGSDTLAGALALFETPPAVSKSVRKSAKLTPVSPDFTKNFTYSLEGDRVVQKDVSSFKKFQSSSVLFGHHSKREDANDREIHSSEKHHNAPAVLESTSGRDLSPTQLKKYTARGRASEEFQKLKDISPYVSKLQKNDELTTYKPRSRKSDTTGSAHKMSTAQAIIDAWRASSFEVLPQKSVVPPTKRESFVSSIVEDIPETSTIKESVSSTSLELGTRKLRSASTLIFSEHKSKEAANVGVSAESTTDHKQGRRYSTSPSNESKEKSGVMSNIARSEKEEIKQRLLRSVLGTTSVSEMAPPSKPSRRGGRRGRSPLRKNRDAKIASLFQEEVLKDAKPSRRSANIAPVLHHRTVTFEQSSPSTSLERVLRSAVGESNHGKQNSKLLHTASEQQEPSAGHVKTPTHLSKTPSQHTKSPTQRSKTPTQRSKTTTDHPKASTSGMRAITTSSIGSTLQSEPVQKESVLITKRSQKSQQRSMSTSSEDDSGFDLHPKGATTKRTFRANALLLRKPTGEVSEKLTHYKIPKKRAQETPNISVDRERHDEGSTLKLDKGFTKPSKESFKTVPARLSSSQSSVEEKRAATRSAKDRHHKASKSLKREPSPSKRFIRSHTEHSASEEDRDASSRERRSSRRHRE